MNQEIKEMVVNGITYVPKGSEAAPAENADGLKYAIVRSREQGVMVGFVSRVLGRKVTLLRARQLWSWDGGALALPDIAECGLATCKMSREMSQPTEMLEACGVMYCTDVAMASLRGIEAHVSS